MLQYSAVVIIRSGSVINVILNGAVCGDKFGMFVKGTCGWQMMRNFH